MVVAALSTAAPISTARAPISDSLALLTSGLLLALLVTFLLGTSVGSCVGWGAIRWLCVHELSAAQKENDVFDEHHVGRRWAEKLALMTRHTGAFRELEGVCKTPYGGVDEDGVDLWIPENQIAAAKEEAKMKMRVASRKFMGDKLKEEQKKINDELWRKIGKPNIPRSRDKNNVMDMLK